MKASTTKGEGAGRPSAEWVVVMADSHSSCVARPVNVGVADETHENNSCLEAIDRTEETAVGQSIPVPIELLGRQRDP